MLAWLHRAGELTAVWAPDDAQEALRDLTRAREDLKHLQRQAKQRLLAFLLRHGQRYEGQSRWTQAHYRWLETLKFAHPVQQIVFQEYLETVKAMNKRLEALDKQLAATAAESVFWLVIEGLMGLGRSQSADSHHHRGRDRRLDTLCQRPATDGVFGPRAE